MTTESTTQRNDSNRIMQTRFNMAVERERFYECEVKRRRVRAAGGYEAFWKVKPIAMALKAGATDAEAVVYEGDEFSALVHLGQVETLKESGSRAIGLRVFLNSGNAQRTASTSSSDFSDEGITRLVDGAITLAKITSE